MVPLHLMVGVALAQDPSEEEQPADEYPDSIIENEEDEAPESNGVQSDLRLIREHVSAVELKENVGLVYTMVYAEGPQSESLGQTHTEETPFEIGSVSKVFTGLLLHDMVQKGEVTLDTTVRDILPDVKMRDDVAAITLKELATHSSGLGRMPPNLGTIYLLRHAKNPYADYDRKKLYKALSRAKIAEEGFEYSNFGAGLLGDLLSVKAGKPYCTLIDERITQPHNLNTITCSSIPDGIAQPHLWTGDENPVWEFDSLAGAGAIRANSLELGVLLSHLDLLYMERALENGHPDYMNTHYKDEEQEVGLGWMIFDIEGERCYVHDGMTGGSSSFVGACPEQELGIILLMNQQDLKFTLTKAGLDALRSLVVQSKQARD